MSQADLEKLDIVVTTYNVLSSEAGAGPAAKKKGKNKVAKLSDIKWKRIVLDEGHTIRNANVRLFACGVAFQKKTTARRPG